MKYLFIMATFVSLTLGISAKSNPDESSAVQQNLFDEGTASYSFFSDIVSGVAGGVSNLVDKAGNLLKGVANLGKDIYRKGNEYFVKVGNSFIQITTRIPGTIKYLGEALVLEILNQVNKAINAVINLVGPDKVARAVGIVAQVVVQRKLPSFDPPPPSTPGPAVDLPDWDPDATFTFDQEDPDTHQRVILPTNDQGNPFIPNANSLSEDDLGLLSISASAGTPAKTLNAGEIKLASQLEFLLKQIEKAMAKVKTLSGSAKTAMEKDIHAAKWFAFRMAIVLTGSFDNAKQLLKW